MNKCKISVTILQEKQLASLKEDHIEKIHKSCFSQISPSKTKKICVIKNTRLKDFNLIWNVRSLTYEGVKALGKAKVS